MNYIHNSLLLDLEVYTKIVPSLDKTITVYGSTKFKELFQILYHSPDYLMRRQHLLKQLCYNNNKNKQKIINNLKKIKKLENKVDWLFTDNTDDYKDMCFAKQSLNVKELVSAKNYFKIYSPLLIIVVYILIYLIMRYNKINISITDYFISLYEGYKMFLSTVINFMIKDDNFVSFLTNILALMYVFYQFYQIYSSSEVAVTHYNKCKDFTTNISTIREFILLTKQIYKNDVFLLNEKKLILKDLNCLNKLFSSSEINNIGSSIILKQTCVDYEAKFNNILQYIGIVDTFINISNLVLYEGYSLPQFDFEKNGPYINLNGMWSPYSNINDQVLNNATIGTTIGTTLGMKSMNKEPNNIILTGPNTSGKSTYIRNLMINIFLSQTIGISCSKYIQFTPFDNLYTYLNIPNLSHHNMKESLFEAELSRCIEFCNIVEHLDKSQYIFTVMDELFTGTNPKEGIASSYGVCEYLGSFPNSMMIVTTHFVELTELENKYKNRFKNMKFTVNRINNKFTRSYVVEPGINDQNIAIELLKDKGYNSKIVEKALNKLTGL